MVISKSKQENKKSFLVCTCFVCFDFSSSWGLNSWSHDDLNDFEKLTKKVPCVICEDLLTEN